MDTRKPWIVGLACLSFVAGSVAADHTDPEGVYIRVVDAGPGLCTVTRMPGDHFMVYDAGHWDHDEVCADAVRDVVPEGEVIGVRGRWLR